jgi:glycosyltransferase involved in cell wall biosynthesis
MVSVVVPAYDQPAFLAEAVRSVVAQTFADFELIVVDDGSPTDLRPAFDEASGGDPRCRYVRQANGGGGAARNHGIALARGRWVAFLDHDDRWLPAKLERQLAAVEAWNGDPPGLAFCQFRKFGERAGRRPSDAPFPARAPSGRILDALLRATLIRTLSVVLVRRDALPPGAAWFRSDLAIANDVELYYRLARRWPFVFVPEVLVEKRDHAANASGANLAMHLEAVRVADELRAQLGPALAGPTRRAWRGRLRRHLLGAARAAARAGDPALSRTCYARALRGGPAGAARALAGWLGSWFRRRR